MASSTVVLIPSDGNNIIQSSQTFPSISVQPSGCIQYGGQHLGISHNARQLFPQMRALEKLLNVETKTLGTIQIMIGLIHIGFGAILYLIFFESYFTLAEIGFYPFWGGLFFIASGSLCVASVKNLNQFLVKCSVGMNIISAIMASIGITLFIADLAIRVDSNQFDVSKPVGIGLSALLLLFSLLEFCITVSAAHFGCQATCCNSVLDSVVFVPYQVNGHMVDSVESNLLPPPEHTTVDSASKAE